VNSRPFRASLEDRLLGGIHLKYRVEEDPLGKVRIPADRYYGAQTQRAVENFPVSGLSLQPGFVRAQAIIKRAAAMANVESGRLDKKMGRALVKAADEVLAGRFDDHFVVDVFQAGAGTSQNMNLNEVLANRACEILGGRRGDHSLVHPNDHANMSQSTNDTIHSAIHVSALLALHEGLLPALEGLEGELSRKAKEFSCVVKSGRTHMQDAVPVTLGQEFGAYATMVGLDRRRVGSAAEALRELSIGGTAVGTGLNTAPEYRERVLTHIADATGQRFVAPEDAFEAMQGMGGVMEVAGALRSLVVSLRKIAGDLILLSSGPRTGLGEIRLPAVQPGSSIMPGKVNPVLPEMLSMVCFHALGCDATISLAAQAGQLELNVMMPVIAFNLLQEIAILTTGVEAFARRCVGGIEADRDVCLLNAERSPSLATALSPEIGYAAAANLAKEALAKDVLIRDLALKKKVLGADEIEGLVDLRRMTRAPWERGGSPGPSKRAKEPSGRAGGSSARSGGPKKRARESKKGRGTSKRR
jgi:fumarate hydratase class II